MTMDKKVLAMHSKSINAALDAADMRQAHKMMTRYKPLQLEGPLPLKAFLTFLYKGYDISVVKGTNDDGL